MGPIFVYPYAPFLSIRETLIFEGEDFDSETRGMDRILVEDWIGKDQKEQDHNKKAERNRPQEKTLDAHRNQRLVK